MRRGKIHWALIVAAAAMLSLFIITLIVVTDCAGSVGASPAGMKGAHGAR